MIDSKIAVILRGGYKPSEKCQMGIRELAFGPDYLIPKPFDARLSLRIAPKPMTSRSAQPMVFMSASAGTVASARRRAYRRRVRIRHTR